MNKLFVSFFHVSVRVVQSSGRAGCPKAIAQPARSVAFRSMLCSILHFAESYAAPAYMPVTRDTVPRLQGTDNIAI